MPLALALALAAIASGALLTYFYDEDAPFAARLCAGVATGFAALGLVGFTVASFLGLTPLSLLITAGLIASPLILLAQTAWRARLSLDIGEAAADVRRAILHPAGRTTAPLIFYACLALLLWLAFDRAMFEQGGAVYTGVDNNLGDLPFHISIITSFARGENFPPEHPEYAGVRLTYPFIMDFVAAMFVRAGARLQSALFWENFVLGLALVGLLHRWALKLTRDRAAALITPVLVLLSGGLGWWLLVREARESGRGLLALLQKLPHDYTITFNGSFRWGNALTTLLIPQRGILLGLPLALIIWTLWWQATETDGAEEVDAQLTESRKTAAAAGGRKQKRVARAQRTQSRPRRDVHRWYPGDAPMRRMIAAGAVAGLLPLVHAHTYVVMMAMGGCLALLFPRWRVWAAFFAVSLALAVPQMLWATRDSAVQAGTFFGWQFGWDHGKQNVLWFWLKNTGLFIPLLIAALVWRGRSAGGGAVVPPRLLLFYVPFTICFIGPNLGKLSPSVWDNIKVIFYWYVASVPLVALLLVRLWRSGRSSLRGLAVAFFILLTLAGALDVWRVISRASQQRIFDRDGQAFAELINRSTPARSLILHAPTYNHPVFLTGRRSPMGYAGHLWTHGIDYAGREADLRRIYAGGAEAGALIDRYGIDYVVVSRLERTAGQVNETFFARYTKVGEIGDYRLYKTARP